MGSWVPTGCVGVGMGVCVSPAPPPAADVNELSCRSAAPNVSSQCEALCLNEPQRIHGLNTTVSVGD